MTLVNESASALAEPEPSMTSGEGAEQPEPP
eukprot:CAMPEP_0182490088 /NCGR_PEP_ID=MMETSP1321-20130603/70_1 /TAXON_ID=91990 /ORGANISM="Bolidomonas sp., Strain RCC1657" /LENGTH=30 /DNA_ID= /DNA_START= /DNA_END= /DNA_ORIENTATION=